MNSAAHTTPGGNYDIDLGLGQLLGILWRGKFVILLCVFLAGLVGLFLGLTATPVYQAKSLLQLEEKSGQLGLPSALADLAEEDPRSVTEIEIIRSYMVLGRAAADLNLDWYAAPVEAPVIGNALTRYDLPLPEFAFLTRFAGPESEIRLDLLEVPPIWVNARMVVTARGDGAFDILLPDGQQLTGTVGVTLRDPAQQFAIRIGQLVGDAAEEFTVVQQSQERTVEALIRKLGVSERGRQSGILQLTFTSTNRAEARRTLDAVMQAYLLQNVARSAAEAKSGLDFVESQLPQAEAAVSNAETALNTFRQAQQSVNMEIETQSLLTQVTALENELSALEARELEIADLYTENHPIYRQFLATRAQLQGRLDALRTEIDALPEAQRDIVNLTRNLELAQAGYSQLLNRAQELRVLQASTIGNVRIIDPARVAEAPVSPKKSLMLAISLVLGVNVGVAFVFLRSFLRKGIRDAEQLEKAGIPVFATLALSADVKVNPRGRGPLPIYTAHNQDTTMAEAFRSLRTSLHFGMLDAQTKSLAIISSAPNVGKSFVAVNLSTVMAQADQKVCLVDADMRRGYLRRFFGVDKQAPGFSDLLAGRATLDEVLQEGPVPGLYFIPRGQVPPNPAELLMRKGLSQLVEELNARFDMAIFDVPPVLAVTDAAIIGRSVGACVAVVRHDDTEMAELETMMSDLSHAGVQVKGAILNAYNPKHAPRRNAYAYRYTYQSRE